MRYPVISNNPHVQAAYEASRRKGNSHKLAEMFAFRAAPKGLTDREFFEGQGTLSKQFAGDEKTLDKLVGVAQRHGYRPNPNDVYTPGLANFPGDPKAFVPASGGRGHIQKVCEERGTACEGAVTVKHRQDEPKRVRLAPDLVNEKVNEIVARNPAAARVDRRELVREVIHKHGGKK